MNKQRRCGYSRAEVLVSLIAAILVVSSIYFVLCAQRRKASKVYCENKLKWIGICEKNYSEDHDANFSWMLSTNLGGTLEYRETGTEAFRHFQAQSNYIQICNMIICPQDTRQAAGNWASLTDTNVSYFVGLDSTPSLPMSIVAGDRNITADSSVTLQASPSTPPSWVKSVGLHGDKGHLVFSDGHVEELDSTGLADAIQKTGIITNHFAVP